jgi:hypothetical protein
VDGANEKKVVHLVGTEVTIAESVIESRTETIYEQIVFMGVDDLADTDNVAGVLEDLRDRADYALEMVKNDSIEVVKTFYDKNPHGYGLVFETTDEEVAREYGFIEMLRPGEEAYELTPWVREDVAYRALIKAVGEGAAKGIGEQVVAKFPSDEIARAKAYEVAVQELKAAAVNA